jgi:uncharacterized membrane protein
VGGTVTPVVSVGIFLAFLLVACLACTIPGVLVTVGFIRLHDRLWSRFELRRPWATAELADTERRFRENR